jgi:hypothetical protein
LFVGLKGCVNKDDDSGRKKKDDIETTVDSNMGNDGSGGHTTPSDPVDKEELPYSIPNFEGEVADTIINDPKYSDVLKFEVDYIDSDEDIGVVISQDRREGTVIGSKVTIKLEVSQGRQVPNDLEGELYEDVVQTLNDAGFKNVKVEPGRKAANRSEENKVYSVVYAKPETDSWENIPSNGRLSASDKIIVYYYESQAPEEPETPDDNTGNETPVTPPVVDTPTGDDGQSDAPSTNDNTNTDTPSTDEENTGDGSDDTVQ